MINQYCMPEVGEIETEIIRKSNEYLGLKIINTIEEKKRDLLIKKLFTQGLDNLAKNNDSTKLTFILINKVLNPKNK